MKSRVRLLGHSLGEVFPSGLLACSTILDLLRLAWPAAIPTLAVYWMVACGVLGGLFVAICGWIDWRALPSGSRARRAGAWQGLGNMIVTAIFATSWLLRSVDREPSGAAIMIGLVGLTAQLVMVWLGDGPISCRSVGVDAEENLFAPSSSWNMEGSAHTDLHEVNVANLDMDRFDRAYKIWKKASVAYEDAMRRMHAGKPEARKNAREVLRVLVRLQHDLLEALQQDSLEPNDVDKRR